MKTFLVFMADLALAPLQGQNPRSGRVEKFDELPAAQSFAEGQKDNWDLVFVFKRIKEGELEKIEQYQKGRRYVIKKS